MRTDEPSLSTLMVRKCACKSFEEAMQRPAQEASASLIAEWQAKLIAEGRSLNTVRTYTSHLNQVAGQRAPTSHFPVDYAEIVALDTAYLRALFINMTTCDRLLFAGVLLYGRSVLDWTWDWLTENRLNVPVQIAMEADVYRREKGGVDLHDPVFKSPVTTGRITEQEANRRLRCYARNVDVVVRVSLGVWTRSGKRLLDAYDHDLEAVLGCVGLSVRPLAAFGTRLGAAATRDPRLRRLGRRTKRMGVGG